MQLEKRQLISIPFTENEKMCSEIVQNVPTDTNDFGISMIGNGKACFWNKTMSSFYPDIAFKRNEGYFLYNDLENFAVTYRFNFELLQSNISQSLIMRSVYDHRFKTNDEVLCSDIFSNIRNNFVIIGREFICHKTGNNFIPNPFIKRGHAYYMYDLN